MEIKKISTVKREITIGYKCDICEKYAENYDNFYHFEHHHSDWGNDSIDSYEYFDVCSIVCYFKQLRKSIEDLEGYVTAEIDNKSVQFINDLLKYFEK